MPLEVPFTYSSENIDRFSKKFFSKIKYFGYALWIGLIIYFFYRYFQFGNLYALAIAISLLGTIGEKIWAKWKKQK